MVASARSQLFRVGLSETLNTITLVSEGAAASGRTAFKALCCPEITLYAHQVYFSVDVIEIYHAIFFY